MASSFPKTVPCKLCRAIHKRKPYYANIIQLARQNICLQITRGKNVCGEPLNSFTRKFPSPNLKMLRNLFSKSSFDSLASNGYNICLNPVGVQSVRWRRKPRWIPKAPSKLFRVPIRTILPEEEKHEWLRLNNNYK